MIKLIVSDIDGTLAGEAEHSLDPEVYETILRLKKEQRIQFAAASGRQAAGIENTFGPIQKEIFYVAENGAYLGSFGRNLFLYAMKREDFLELVEDMRSIPELELMIGGAKHTYVESPHPEFYDMIKNGYHFDVLQVEDVTKVEDEILKVAAYRRDGIRDAAESIFRKYSGRLKTTVSGERWLDCMAPGVNKGEGVRILQESLGITPEETMAFGDQQNDIEMLNRAYYSFAVGNATDAVKKAARFQADTNTNQGVLKILKLLLQP